MIRMPGGFVGDGGEGRQAKHPCRYPRKEVHPYGEHGKREAEERGRNEDEVHAHRARRHKQPSEHKVLALRDGKGDEEDVSLLPDKSNGRPASFSTDEARLPVKEKRLSLLKEIVAEMSAKSLWRVCSSRDRNREIEITGHLQARRGGGRCWSYLCRSKCSNIKNNCRFIRTDDGRLTKNGSLHHFFSLSLSLSSSSSFYIFFSIYIDAWLN